MGLARWARVNLVAARVGSAVGGKAGVGVGARAGAGAGDGDGSGL